MRLSWPLLGIVLVAFGVSGLRLEQKQQEVGLGRDTDRKILTPGRAQFRRGKNSRPATRSEEAEVEVEVEQEEAEAEEEDGFDWINGDISDTDDRSLESTALESASARSAAPRDIFTCCNQVFGSCRTACEKLSLVQLDLGNGREEPRAELRKYCQLHQLEFWSCVNSTLEAVDRGKSWSGRRCCQAAVLPKCMNSCATAVASHELTEVCRRSDEQVLYDCFEHQEAADSCCGQARTSECLQACREVFEPPNETGSSNGDGKLVDEACGQQNADVLQCIRNHTDMTPPLDIEKYLPCCEYSHEEKCHHTCSKVLQAAKLQQRAERSDVIFARLEAGCGMPLPHLPFWQCFLTVTRKLYAPAQASAQATRRRPQLSSNGVGGAEPNKLGIDAAKRQCCEHASSHKCRRLCSQIFTNDWWESRVSFDTECLEQPAELNLKRCIESVDAPCELGCQGLSFCSNFNNRPTQLFRTCSAVHDAAAREDFLLLQQRGFIRVLGQELYIKNATRCAPDKWQALVCALQLQPCTRVGLYNGICREDCTELLDECLDWTRQPQRPKAICDRLQPPTKNDEPTPCISLRSYLTASTPTERPAGGSTGMAISSPCTSKPCNASEACVLQRNGYQGYSCVPGCSLGQASALLVPFGAYVRVGKTSSPSSGIGLASGQLLSAEHVVCRCGMRGQVDQCQPLPSYTHAHCVLPGGRSFRHGSSFYLECNLCSCFAGEITCTKQQCRLPGYVDVSYTSLPCNCPAHYVPVCGSNGNTYPSACVAKCLGLLEASFVFGACNARSTCQAAVEGGTGSGTGTGNGSGSRNGSGASNCPTGTLCLEQRQICLSSMQRPCPQFVCVNMSAPGCGIHHAEQLCDTEGKTHSNPCSLLQSSSKLAYWGPCRPTHETMEQSDLVCGINGVTYRSSAAALADFVTVDYVGRCREVGLLVSDMGRRCRTVQCPRLSSKHCRLIVPPGACCPICGGAAFRIIYSRKQLDRAFYALRGQHSSLLTLHGILRELDHLVQVSECQLSGFLTMEVGIFVAIVPRGQPSSSLQLKVCEAEAEKISSLISSQSPRITTNLALSSLTVSHMLEPTINGAALSIINRSIILAMGLVSSAHLWINV